MRYKNACSWIANFAFNVHSTFVPARLPASVAALTALTLVSHSSCLCPRPQVSLWVGEQFASDLSAVFPGLNVKCLSSNKILALLGQGLSGPQTGFDFTVRSGRSGLLPPAHHILSFNYGLSFIPGIVQSE